MPLHFVPVKTAADQKQLAELACEIWNEYWPERIGQGQTDYMVQKFQSIEAIREDMACNGYEYWFLYVDDGEGSGHIAGYTGGHDEPETNRYFISKIYLRSSARGNGYARRTVEFFDALCHVRGLDAMYLTVNKYNDIALRAYEGTGFVTIDSTLTDIGGGFAMDDFIMERKVDCGI